MSVWTKLRYLSPSRRRAAERDMQEELESLTAIAGPGELGNLTLAAENARGAWTWLWLERLGQDLRYAFRSIGHNKAFTALAALCLALGIGANTAIYSFMESILLRSLPVADPDSLVVMKWRADQYTSAASKGHSWSTEGTHVDPGGGGLISTQFPYAALDVFQRNSDVLSSAFAYFADDRLSLTTLGETESVKGQYVSGDYFSGMGVQPAAGRLFFRSDDIGTANAAVLSHRFSRRRFGDAGRAVGQAIRVNDKPFTVVGVTPPGFFGAEPGSVPDLYVPMSARTIVVPRMRRQDLDPNFYWIEIMARLAPGVSVARAQAVLEPQFRQFVESTVSTERQRATLPDLLVTEGAAGLDSLRRRYAKPVFVLMAMVGLILLLGCANVANLLMARATARRREIAVRLSIGASRGRVIRQLLTESAVLSSIGGALGLAFAWWGIQLLTLLLATGRENFTLHAELNPHVLAVTFGLSILTGLLFGLAPAIQGTRVDVMPALKEVRPGALAGSPSRGWSRGLGHSLVVAQIAISLVVLVAAGLFQGTLSNLHAIELGFNRHDVLLFTLRPTTVGYQGPALTRLYGDLHERLSSAPNVRGVSLSSRPLPTGGGSMTLVNAVGVPERPPPGPGERPRNAAGLLTVGPAFFETMQIPLVAGREFAAGDREGATAVAVINQRLARILGLTNPIGSAISLGDRENRYEVVGVVGDALFLFLKEDLRPMVYFPYTQGSGPPGQMTYELRAAGDPLALTNTVRHIVRELDDRLAVSDVTTQAMHVDQAINQEITLARLGSAFATLALVIACVGLYGTVAYNVSRRTGEIGIRMALGARRAGIVWLVLRSVLILELLGLSIGVPIALAGSRYLESLLYGIEPNDPVTVAAGIVVLLTAGLAASYMPAMRASSIDPMVAVRHE